MIPIFLITGGFVLQQPGAGLAFYSRGLRGGLRDIVLFIPQNLVVLGASPAITAIACYYKFIKLSQ